MSDQSLFDTTGDDTGVKCKSNKPFMYYLSVQDVHGSDAKIAVTFEDASVVFYPIKEDTSFSLAQAAGGGTGHADNELAVTVTSGHVAGRVSIMT